jgi:hypothetical protein
MRHELRVDRWPGQALLIVMALLTLAVGFCLFDGDEMDKGIFVDLCQALALLSTAVVVLTSALIQLLSADPRPATYAASVRRLDPPPKLSFLS